MIANIVNGRNLAKHKGPTLVVAPATLVHQWHGEFLRHAEKRFLGSVTRYYAGNRGGDRDRDPEEVAEYLRSFTIIITTYAEISNSYPKQDPPLHLTDPISKEEWWNAHYAEHKGGFHRVDFHRLILDEAQAIKNHKSITSLACRAVKATHRWAISGTPVQNTLSEFYPYFRFLQVPYTGDFRAFKHNYCTEDDPSGAQRLSAMLRQLMLRRTHGDMLMGSKLLSLPAMDHSDYMCHLSSIERGLYEVVHKRFIKRINVLSRSGLLKKNYSNVLVMLLRLRQLVAHPLLIQDTIRDLLEPEDFQDLKRVLTEVEETMTASDSPKEVILHLRRMLRSPKDLAVLDASKDLTSSGADKDPNIITVDDNDDNTPAGYAPAQPSTSTPKAPSNPDSSSSTSPTPTEPTPSTTTDDATPHGGSFGLRSSYSDFIDELRDLNALDEPANAAITLCASCSKPAVGPHETSCGHTYCFTCICDVAYRCSQSTDPRLRCLECKQVCTGTRKNNVGVGEKRGGKSRAGSVMGGEGGGAGGGRGMWGDEEGKKKSAKNVVDTWVDAEGKMLPSAKTLAFKAQVLEWLRFEPGVKIM